MADNMSAVSPRRLTHSLAAVGHTTPSTSSTATVLSTTLWNASQDLAQAALDSTSIQGIKRSGLCGLGVRSGSILPPLYAAVVMIPCDRLWYWLGTQLKPYAVETNVYSFWIGYRDWGWPYPDSLGELNQAAAPSCALSPGPAARSLPADTTAAPALPPPVSSG